MTRSLCAILVLVACFLPARIEAEVPRIFFDIADTTVSADTGARYLSVYLDNFYDSIAGYQFVVRSSRPDLVWFDTTNDGFDTTATLTSGFEFIEEDVDVDYSGYWFACIAEVPWVLGITPPFPPQQGGIAVKVKYYTADSLPGDTSRIKSVISIEQPFDFSDPYGVSIGVVTDTTIDTNYWHCNNYEADSCTDWTQVSPGSGLVDSVSYDTAYDSHLDTTQVVAVGGSVTVIDRIVCDNDRSGDIDISDLVCLIKHMFHPDQSQPCADIYCDGDNSGAINITDLTILIAYMFREGPLPGG